MGETTIQVTKDSVIGDLIETAPAAADVIKKYFGDGCFTCPGVKMETIGFGASMHNVNVEDMIQDLNKALS